MKLNTRQTIERFRISIFHRLAHHGRIKRQDIVTVLTDTQVIVAHLFRRLRWQFLPREANFIADHYAGVAMRFACRHFYATPLPNDVQVKTDLPYALLYRAGARISGRNMNTSNSILVFQYNAVSWVDWTAPSVRCLARKAVVRGAHARATDTSVIFGI